MVTVIQAWPPAVAGEENMKTDLGYQPPANPEAEQSVLGAILVRPTVLDEVYDLLRPVDF
jgi:hypothetical protein